MALHVAILGGNGFVGGALARHLLRLGDMRVSVLGRPDFDLVRPETFQLIDESVDVVVHAAGAVGADRPEREFWDVNVISTHDLVSCLNRWNRPPHLIYLSTGAVNGGAEGCVDSSFEPHPSGSYALTKYLAEEIVRKAYRGTVSIPRLYFPYGPGQGASRLVPGLVKRVLAGEPVLLNEAGRPLLSLVYIDDLVIFLERLIHERKEGVMNVAGVTRATIDELVAVIEAQLGRTAVRRATGNAVADFCAGDCIGGDQTTLVAGIRAVCEFVEGAGAKALS